VQPTPDISCNRLLKMTSKSPISRCLMLNNHAQQSMSRKGTFYDHRLRTGQYPRPKS
jgi:hypothetical protein